MQMIVAGRRGRIKRLVLAVGVLSVVALLGCTGDVLTGFKCAQPRSPTMPPSYECQQLMMRGPTVSKHEQQQQTKRIEREAYARQAHARKVARERAELNRRYERRRNSPEGNRQRKKAALKHRQRLAGIEKQLNITGMTVGALLRRGKAGDPRIHYKLGMVYDKGLLGVTRDAGKATVWYRRAVDQGHLGAHYELANILDTVSPRDPGEALRLFLVAAKKGHVPSQYVAALKFDTGVVRGGYHVLRKNPAKALHWYERAASNGHQESQVLLAQKYIGGVGVKKDIERGIALHRKYADQGNHFAMYSLAQKYERGEYLEKDLRKATRLYRTVAHGQSRYADSARHRLKALERTAEVRKSQN